MKTYLTLLLFLLLFSAQAQLEYTGFESFADETVFTQASWTAEGFSVPWVNGFDQNRAYVDDAYAKSGSKSLRIKYPVNNYGPSNNGAQAPLVVPAANQLYMSYWVRFSDNFSWGNTSEGGKLPGLGGGARCSGCAVCTGSNGFSARLMWRNSGRAVLYLYHMEADKANPPCGDNLQLQLSGVDFYFQKGQWYNIIERVKVNTGTNHDGEVELWINEQQALLVTGIQFVSNGDKVDNLYFSTFHGGSTAGWSPTVDCYTWFDDIKIGSTASEVFTTLSLQDHAQDLSASSANSIHMMPNPLKASGTATLEIPESSKEEMLRLEWLDITGKLMAPATVLESSGSCHVPDLLPGIYTIKISSSREVIFKKVLIE